MNTVIKTQYFKDYRKELGFANQEAVKNFFAGKDITPTVDFNYIKLLNTRLFAIIIKINSLVSADIKLPKIDDFCTSNVDLVFTKLKNNNIISRLNNQGRRPEQVYFSWMRGYIVSSYFLKALSKIFGVSLDNISLIGDDDLVNIESFKRTPTADLEITLMEGQTVFNIEQNYFSWKLTETPPSLNDIFTE